MTSDSRWQQDVGAERAAQRVSGVKPSIDGADVTPTGTVRNGSEREAATSSTWGTPGGRNVVDEMTLAN